MPTDPSVNSKLFSSSAGSRFRLIACVLLALVLMMGDLRGDWSGYLRYHAAVVIEPVYQLAAVPAKLLQASRDGLVTRRQLHQENRRLRQELLLANARLNRAAGVARQNDELKRLLDTRRQLHINVQLAQLVDIDMGVFHNRIRLNAGHNQGVRTGRVVMDADGIMGQVIDVMPDSSVVMLITDAEAAVPVVVARTGQRAVAYGSENADLLNVPGMPLASDIRRGDELISSGLGGGYPAGFPVARIVSVRAGESGMFLAVAAEPAARLDYSNNVLILQDLAPTVGPPAVAPEVGPPQLPPEVEDDAE